MQQQVILALLTVTTHLLMTISDYIDFFAGRH